MLTLLAWEEMLQHGPFAAEQAWSAREDGLHLDFSRVEFADFGALARALLLLDAAVRYRIPATVTLPTPSVPLSADGKRPTVRLPCGGGAEPTLAARRAWARGDALTFMRHIGFLDSLRAPHWAAGAVRVRHESRLMPGTCPMSQAPVPEPDPRRSEPYRRRRVFPFRWLEPMPAAQQREAESYLAVSSGLEDLGLSRSDARTLSQTVLTELVANVAEHGADGERPPVALVGAVLLSAETYSIRQEGIHPDLGEIADRAVEDGSLVLRLVVADSGASLVTRLASDDRLGGTDVENPPGRLARGNRPERPRRTVQRSCRASGPPAWPERAFLGGPRGAQLPWRRSGAYRRPVGRSAYGRTAEGTEVAETGLGYVPGTLLELTLPTGLSVPAAHALGQ